MLKFRVDIPVGESRKQGGEAPVLRPTQPARDVRRNHHSYEEIVLDVESKEASIEETEIALQRVPQTALQTGPQTGPQTAPHAEPQTAPQTAPKPTLEMVSSDADNQKIVIPIVTPDVTINDQSDSKRLSINSEEYELHQAMIGNKVSSLQNNNTGLKRQWSIPDTDSEDDFSKKQQTWAQIKANGLLSINTENKSPTRKFNLPSDSDEEDPYSTAKSPSLSIKSAEPPLPPPVSTIPRTYKAKQGVQGTAQPNQDTAHPNQDTAQHLQNTAQHIQGFLAEEASTPEKTQDTRKKLTVNALVDIRKRSITSTSDTDPYDEIDCGAEETAKKVKEGQSQPRYKFTLSKSKNRLNPPQNSLDTTYAEIPKKTQWNFPSSSDEDEEVEQRRHKKSNMGRPKLARQDSNTSEDEDRPMLPPKLWESSAHGSERNIQLAGESAINAADSQMQGRNPQAENDQDDVTIEYSALKRSDLHRKGSLLGPDDNDPVEGNSNSYNEDSNDVGDTLSVLSETSSKTIPDYEQSSTCVDMDQLSLDSSGKRPKRIVETHETHEIVPADNNEDDIVERIIETQTITEKLDDNRSFNDYSGDDYLKCIGDDDEFVSHIFTLGRTIERGGKKKKSKDFAFVENPFSAPDAVIETMPLEKKTVKQKITTLVKKKKAKDDENVYAEVRPSDSHDGEFAGSHDGSGFNDREAYDDEDEVDNYDHTNDLQRRPGWDSYNEIGGANGEPSQRNRISNMSNDSSGLVYETFDDSLKNSAKDSSAAAEKKKESKPEKKSLFKGIKKFLKMKDKTQESSKTGSLVLEDDYQEFVP